MDKVKDILASVIGMLIILLVVWIIAIVVCIFVIFIVWVSANSNAEGFDVTYRTWDNLNSIQIFSVIEGWVMNPLKTMFANFQHGVIFSSEFRFVLLLIVVLEVCVMGLALMIGHDKLTVRDIGMDILITFGGAAILLSPSVMEYLNLAYGVITGAESWLLTIFRDGILENMGNSLYISGNSNPTYSVMDMIASTFFDPVVAKRVQTKMLGLLFAGYIHFVPLLALALLYCVISTFSVFFAMLSAKIIVLFTLQLIPFFLLFSALNDAKVKVSKNLQAKDQSFLWTAVDVGIIQPSLFIIIISFASNFMLYALILAPMNDLLTFTVYIHTENQWIKRMTWIPIFGQFLALLIKQYPKAIGVRHDLMFEKLFLMSVGILLFRNIFPIVCGFVKDLCISASSAAAGAFITKDGQGVFDKGNPVGKVVEPVAQAPLDAVKSGGAKLGSAIMSKASGKDGDKKANNKMDQDGKDGDDSDKSKNEQEDSNKYDMPDYNNDDDGDGQIGN